jgi:hypothetical protein
MNRPANDALPQEWVDYVQWAHDNDKLIDVKLNELPRETRHQIYSRVLNEWPKFCFHVGGND